MMTKKEIRTKIIKQRNTLSNDFVEKNSKDIFELMKSTNILDFETVLIYCAFKNEVETKSIIDYLVSHGREVYVPKCNIDLKEFVPVRITENNFRLNAYGIFEPTDEIYAKKQIQCAIVPGVAFDMRGNRIGFGAGYYDKFFNKNPDVYKIGICYEFQLVDNIPSEDYDIPMDVIITNERIISV